MREKDWVLANWQNRGYWYLGVVREVTEGGQKLRVMYPQDESEEWVEACQVVPQPDLEKGTRVECLWESDGGYYAALVIDYDQSLDWLGRTYKVRYEDGTETWTTLGQMRLAVQTCRQCGGPVFGKTTSCPGCGAAIS